jgi:hypothetical protein
MGISLGIVPVMVPLFILLWLPDRHREMWKAREGWGRSVGGAQADVGAGREVSQEECTRRSPSQSPASHSLIPFRLRANNKRELQHIAVVQPQRDWRPTSPDHERNRAQACSHGVVLPRAMQKACVRLCYRTLLPFPFQHSKRLFVPVKFISVFSDTQSIYNHMQQIILF